MTAAFWTRRPLCWLTLWLGLGAAGAALAQEDADPQAFDLSLEELLQARVTSVSRRPEPLQHAPSAIQVITREEIRRSGATRIPEALRLATNLQVAQVNANEWSISARGFNNVLANKLLVLIDGRSVYGTLFSGVAWDVQDVLLEDVERIEVVSGPGGTLWGANAVNGVINIITRPAEETQGSFAQLGAGSELHSQAAARFGGALGGQGAYRLYGKGFRRGGTRLFRDSRNQQARSEAHDSWSMSQGGFRTDWRPGGADRLTLQGDLYGGRPESLRDDQPTASGSLTARGGNLLARWSRPLGEGSELQLQMYWDRTGREGPSGLDQVVNSYDADAQHRFRFGARHEIVWGAGYRLTDDRSENSLFRELRPPRRVSALYSGFVQDQITLLPALELTLGSKLEHHAYTGYEVQPSGRLAWTPSDTHTLWAALSRARRTPSRLERSFRSAVDFGPPFGEVVFFQGNEGFESEDLVASELGWRAQPAEWLSWSVSGFYNRYRELRTAEPGPGPFPPLPVTFDNGARGRSYGAELSAMLQPAPWWRLRAGYTRLVERLEVRDTSADLNRAAEEYRDPGHQWLLHSSFDLSHGVALDAVLRYVDTLSDQDREPKSARVPSYYGLDVALRWRLGEFELALSGQNLLDSAHREFISADPPHREIERSVLLSVSWRR